MKKLRKIAAIALIGVLAFGLVACGTKSPTDVVNEYFSQVKDGKNDEVNKLLVQETEAGNKDQKDDKKEDKEESKAMTDALKQIDAKVNSEKIDGDTATVNVTVKGPNVSQAMVAVFSKTMALAFQGKEVSSDDSEKMFEDEIKNAKVDERTVDIQLKQVDKEWKIQPGKELTKALLGEGKMPTKK